MDVLDMYKWWNGAAQQNAMNAIMSNKQDWDSEEFFATGNEWLADHRQFARIVGVTITGSRALDFGCGIGRVTNHLAAHYSEVVGVDISDEMIRLAREQQRSPAVRFEQVKQLPLPFADQAFDLVYSTLVIQHIPLPYNLGYVDEFFRMARAVVMFDAPSHPLRSGDWESPPDGIFLLHRDLVLNRAQHHEFELLGLRQYPGTAWRHYQYLFERQPAWGGRRTVVEAPSGRSARRPARWRSGWRKTRGRPAGDAEDGATGEGKPAVAFRRVARGLMSDANVGTENLLEDRR
jgi:SAM-dependent methyltransferase